MTTNNINEATELGDHLIDTVEDIERIERDAWIDLFAAAPADFTRSYGLSATQIDEFGLLAIKAYPSIVYNRSSVVGISPNLDVAALENVTKWLSDHCGPTWAISVIARSQSHKLRHWLTKKSFRLIEQETAKFWRDAITLPPAINCNYEIRLATEEHAIDFGLTISQGFEMDAEFAKWRETLCGRQRWYTYVAYEGLEPVGAGAMYVKDDLAWLGMGTTLPQYRGKGVQQALLARRIIDARALGVKILTVEAIHGGTGKLRNQSYRNVIRAGFQFAYLRQQYVAHRCAK